MRDTIELLLPESGAKVILYSHLVSGDFKLIQKALADRIHVKIDNQGKPLEGEIEKMKEIPMSVMLDEANETTNVLVKEAFLADGTKVVDISEFVYNLSINDGKNTRQ
jgi:hypothetical protein